MRSLRSSKSLKITVELTLTVQKANAYSPWTACSVFNWKYLFQVNLVQKLKIASLRYYATLKVRKCESLLYKVNRCLQKTTTCTGLRTEQIFSVNIYMYFSVFGVVFTVIFLCYFQKLQLLDVKTF